MPSVTGTVLSGKDFPAHHASDDLDIIMIIMGLCLDILPPGWALLLTFECPEAVDSARRRLQEKEADR